MNIKKMTNINKTIEEFEKLVTYLNANYGVDDFRSLFIKALKAQEQEHQKITDFLIESHAFDIKELKDKHQKKLKEINEFGGDEPRVYSPELSHTSPVGALRGVEPIHITKRREEVARRANNPQKQLL